MATDTYIHESLARGDNYMAKLNERKLAICGAGALGSNLACTLARIGSKDLRVIDFDRVQNHNLPTQTFAIADIGALKTTALMKHIFESTHIEIDAVPKRLVEGNIKQIFRGVGLAVDCFDNRASRLLVKTYCDQAKIPCLHAGLSGDGYGEVCWNETYRVPQDAVGDPCDYALTRNLVQLVVAIAAEEILDFCLAKEPRRKNWSITLEDLQVRSMT